MLDMFKKSFEVPYEDIGNYPSLTVTMEAITKYCETNGETCTFTGEDEVEISGKKYEIIRGIDGLSRGCYGIRCREK